MGQACSCLGGSPVKVDSVLSIDTSQSTTPTNKDNNVNGMLVSSLEAEKSIMEAMNGSGAGFSKQGSLPLTRFTIKELLKATKNFKSDFVLGEGAFGKVFKGYINVPHLGAHLACAVKRLNPESLQGQEEWMAEILILGSVKHPNLIRLFGYCSEKQVGYLVYELASMGSLDRLLYKPDGPSTYILTWRQRVKVAYQIAQALSHLHSKRIIHRDLKPSNVLLDENMNVKLTDFGLAKVASSSQSNLTTRILGTMGYLDPHYVETGQVSRLSDVYAYGVMLLELLTGRKSINSGTPAAKPLPSFAQEFFSQKRPNVLAFLDPEVVEDVCLLGDEKVATFLGIMAKHCTSWNVSQRPTMVEVVDIFRDLLKDKDILA